MGKGTYGTKRETTRKGVRRVESEDQRENEQLIRNPCGLKVAIAVAVGRTIAL